MFKKALMAIIATTTLFSFNTYAEEVTAFKIYTTKNIPEALCSIFKVKCDRFTDQDQ